MSKRDLLYEIMKGNQTLEINPITRYSLLLYFALSTPFAITLAILESLFNKGGSLCLVFKKTS